jgi:hypothetical protein
MQQKRNAAVAKRSSDAALHRVVKWCVCLGFGGFLIIAWMHFCHNSGLAGPWAEPRLLTGIALVLVGQVFIVPSVWHFLFRCDGATLLGQPINRRANPVKWFAFHGIFLAGGMLLIVLAILNWSGVIDMTPSSWNVDAEKWGKR